MEKLKEVLDFLQLKEDEDTINMFENYMKGILDWNERINLTAIKDRDEFIRKHFIDSLLCANSEEYKNGKKILDLGTGGGFPGVPLAIISPDKDFILMDSLRKKLKVVEELSNIIGLRNISVLHGRAEELARNKDYRENFDVCVSRAVANLSVLLEYTLPFVRVDGTLIAFKGPDVDNELKDASKAIDILGGKLDRIEKPNINGFDLNHNLLYIKKIKTTNKKFPRKAGIPVKEPII